MKINIRPKTPVKQEEEGIVSQLGKRTEYSNFNSKLELRKRSTESVQSQWLQGAIPRALNVNEASITELMTGDPQRHSFERKQRSRSRNNNIIQAFTHEEVVKNPLNHHQERGSVFIGGNDVERSYHRQLNEKVNLEHLSHQALEDKERKVSEK